VNTLIALVKNAGKLYNASKPHYEACKAAFIEAHAMLASRAAYSYYGDYFGNPVVHYNVFRLEAKAKAKAEVLVTRPVRPDLFLENAADFLQQHDAFIASLRNEPQSWTAEQKLTASRVIYTAVMSVACCYDLWRRSSRKTPGTFLEILIAGILQKLLPGSVFTKHVPLATFLPDDEIQATAGEEANLDDDSTSSEEASAGGGVSTDLVIGVLGRPGGIVVPLKITTRERIVQPFAHQRILDSACGVGVYQSLLVCMSETQLDDRTKTVKQVCVPGTIKLFQKYLAPLSGIYYCDIPQRYAADDMKGIISVKSVGDFFEDLSKFLAQHSSNRV